MIRELIEKKIRQDLDLDRVAITNSYKFGEFSLNPGEIASIISKLDITPEELTGKLNTSLKQPDLADKVLYEAGFINIYLTSDAILSEIDEIQNNVNYFENSDLKSKTIIFDYSQPNIAKPFSVGHLRSTVIGQANYNIHKLLGYKTVGINHIGDWGTQFGKLVYAVKTWGDEKQIEKDPIKQLVSLYQRFHREAEDNPKLNEQASQWFRKLELHDVEATELWKKCIDWSFTEFDRLYKVLAVNIDETVGESFYADKTDSVISELKDKGLLKKSEGAQIVELDDMPPAIIQKTNESTLYLTRDLAAVKYRIEKYHPDEIIYHVGNDQYLHFCQLFAVVSKLGWSKNTRLTFAGHGMMRLETGKMSTRAGRVILLDDLISQAKEKSLAIINEKNPDLKNKDEIAQKIGISALKYADLVSNRKSDIVFSFDKVITLKGNSGPYLQYTYARSASILRKLDEKFQGVVIEKHFLTQAKQLAREIIFTRDRLETACKLNSPNIVCELAFRIAEEFNNLYEKQKIITEDKRESAKNAYIVKATKNILGTIFDLLGLDKLEEI